MSNTIVSVDGFILEPAPICTINKTYNRLENGTPISASYNITLSMILVSDMGSPRSKIDTSLSNTGWGGPDRYFWTSSGRAPTETITADQKLASIERKQEAIRQLFRSTAGTAHHLEIQSADGSFPIKATVTLQDITFSEAIWVNTCNCSISLKSNKLSVFGSAYDDDHFEAFPYLIESISENWNFETDETPESQTLPRTYRTTHSLQCKGITKYDESSPPSILSPAWVQARNAVFNDVYVGGPDSINSPFNEFVGIGFDNVLMPLSGVRDLPSYYVKSNHIRTESIDKGAGTYGITEQWILSSGRSLFDFTVEKQDDINNPTTTVSINGTITGLEERNETTLALITSKYTNANIRLSGEVGNFHSWCQSYGGVSLNPIPTAKTIGKNPTTGVISTAYSFDNRATNFVNGGSGIRSENITIGYSHQGDIIAEIFCLGRTTGPVLQNLNTKTAKRKTLNISAVLEPQSTLSPALPYIDHIITAVEPIGTQVYTNEPPEENIQLNGTYNYSRSWTYE